MHYHRPALTPKLPVRNVRVLHERYMDVQHAVRCCRYFLFDLTQCRDHY